MYVFVCSISFFIIYCYYFMKWFWMEIPSHLSLCKMNIYAMPSYLLGRTSTTTSKWIVLFFTCIHICIGLAFYFFIDTKSLQYNSNKNLTIDTPNIALGRFERNSVHIFFFDRNIVSATLTLLKLKFHFTQIHCIKSLNDNKDLIAKMVHITKLWLTT